MFGHVPLASHHDDKSMISSKGLNSKSRDKCQYVTSWGFKRPPYFIPMESQVDLLNPETFLELHRKMFAVFP